MRKTIAFLTLIILILTGSLLGLVGYLSNGFTDWSKFVQSDNKPSIEQPDNSEQEQQKEIVSTIVETAEYGTFILPKTFYKKSMVNSEVLYPNNTNFSYIIYENKLLNNMLSLDFKAIEVDFGLLRTSNCHNSAEYFGGTELAFDDGTIIYKLTDSTIKLQDADNQGFNFDIWASVIPIFYNNNGGSITFFNFFSNVYCQEFEFIINPDILNSPKAIMSAVIISDIGCPLTEAIYQKIILDEATKVTYTYAD